MPQAADTSFADQLVQVLPRLLGRALPDDWDPRATTYDLPRFHSEAEFARHLHQAVQQILTEDITDAGVLRELLRACGQPYDYARLGQPLSTVYELWLEARTGAAKAVSFASRTKPYLAVIEAPGSDPSRIRLLAQGALPLSVAKKAELSARGVEIHERVPQDFSAGPAEKLTIYVSDGPFEQALAGIEADAVCFALAEGGVLLIKNAQGIDPKGIQLIRKRTVAALLAPNALRELEKLAGLAPAPLPIGTEAACSAQMRRLYPQIEQVLYFCTGLAAEAAVFSAAAEALGPEPMHLFYAQNGYGGTGQLIGEILPGESRIIPMPLPVLAQDEAGNPLTLVDGLIAGLDKLAGAPACVFLETPTNPELQVHDFARLMAALRRYESVHGQRIPVLVDTTLAPLYPLFAQDFAQHWPFVLVKSGSKYFTKGKATLGVAAVAADPLAQRILAGARAFGQDADAFAKVSQLAWLAEGLQDLEPRMARIAANTQTLAEGIRAALQRQGHQVLLYSMSPEQLEQGLASGILSFYLPSAPTDHDDLVDEFVDYLLAQAPGLVRNRVSYGQSSGEGRPDLFYVINPQESTQGSLPEAVKDAQKRDNVQICRISVPEHADVEGLLSAMENFFALKYPTRQSAARL